MARKSKVQKNSLALDQTASVSKETIGQMSNASEPQSLGTDRTSVDSKVSIAEMSVPSDTIVLIMRAYRDRRFAMDQRKRSDLAMGAYLRSALGWRKDLPEAERKGIAVKAAAVAKNPEGTAWESMIRAQAESRAPFEAIEAAALKEMEHIAKALPVWKDFGEGVRGFGVASLAVILAEAGDLSNYPDKSKLWKRMGLAVMGDVRQGGLAKGAGAEAWIAHGYNPSRRSAMWNIGDTMLKAQIRQVKDADGKDTGERIVLGVYGETYLTRKQYEIARNPDITPMQAHRRAQRYMEKRLLKNLWQAWRRTNYGLAENPNNVVSDVSTQIAA